MATPQPQSQPTSQQVKNILADALSRALSTLDVIDPMEMHITRVTTLSWQIKLLPEGSFWRYFTVKLAENV